MESKNSIDINADLGEFRNEIQLSNELEILKYISSCSVACGGHIGTNKSVRLILEECRKYGVAIGPHPSYPDKEGFGRRKMDISLKDLDKSLRKQIQYFFGIANSLSMPVRHIKLHGTLYNETARQENLINLLLNIVESIEEKIAIIGPTNSLLEKIVSNTNIPFISEAFVDRRYREDYGLVDRSKDGAFLVPLKEQISQARNIVINQVVTTENGLQIDINADTLCIHGDNPNSLKLVKEITDMLKKENIKVQTYSS